MEFSFDFKLDSDFNFHDFKVFSVFIPSCLAMPTRKPHSHSAVSTCTSINFVLCFLNRHRSLVY